MSLKQLTDEEVTRLDNTFTYHAPSGDQTERYVVIRAAARCLAIIILEESKPSREQSLALTKIEEAVMHANAGIARNG